MLEKFGKSAKKVLEKFKSLQLTSWKSSEKSKKIVYLPIYMTMFIDKTQLGADLIYKLDIDSLNKYVGA